MTDHEREVDGGIEVITEPVGLETIGRKRGLSTAVSAIEMASYQMRTRRGPQHRVPEDSEDLFQ